MNNLGYRFCSLIVALFLSSAVLAEPFKVGVTLPLSGMGAEYGTAALNGIKLAKKEHPKLFNNVRFIIGDNKYDSKTNVTLFNKLRDQDKIQLLYSWGDPTTIAIAPLAEKHKLPLVGLGVDPKHTSGKKYVVRFYNYAEQYSLKMLEYINDNNWKSIGALVVEDVYSLELLSGIERNLQPGQKLEVFGTFQPNEFDFKAHIIKAKKRSYDGIVNLLFPGQVSQYFLQAAQLKYSLPNVGSDVFASRTEIKSAKGQMDGKSFAYHHVLPDFRERYLEEFGNDIYLVYACNSYAFALLVGQLFGEEEQGGRISPEELMRRLKKPEQRSSALGNYVFRDHPKGGQFYDFPIYLMKITGNDFVRIK